MISILKLPFSAQIQNRWKTRLHSNAQEQACHGEGWRWLGHTGKLLGQARLPENGQNAYTEQVSVKGVTQMSKFVSYSFEPLK